MCIRDSPKILELVIDLNYKFSENGKILVNKSITQRSSYNNISDKFELSKSEDILKDNLVEIKNRQNNESEKISSSSVIDFINNKLKK